MKYSIIFAGIFMSLASARPGTSKNDCSIATETDSFGTKTIHPRSVNQAKRDLSLSYAATNIDSKEGTRVKTITVIKNIGKKDGKLVINPELHKNEEWANAFRDNFDSYGTIPDVPDIDDLFEFVKKDKSKGKNEEVTEKAKAKDPSQETEKPVNEPPAEIEDSAVVNERPVEKIKGDAELIPGGTKEENTTRSQSLSFSKLRTGEPLVNVNYSTPQHSVHQYFENYVQANSKGYDYPQPCVNTPANSISVSTPLGRTYDIPVGNGSGGANPYIAPAIAKKVQIPPQDSAKNIPATPNQQTYPVNSLLPPLQPNSGSISSTTAQIPFQSSTSQRPYVAPNLRNGQPANLLPPTTPPYRNGPTNFRTNIFGLGANRPNTARSRGLKY